MQLCGLSSDKDEKMKHKEPWFLYYRENDEEKEKGICQSLPHHKNFVGN